jgi:uncharacterized protein (TIGR03435 family)
MRILVLFCVACLPMAGQETKPLAFEVAEVKLNKSGEQRMSARLINGQVRVVNAPLRLLLAEAFRMPNDTIAGAPGWLDSDRYDIVAKAGPETPEDDLRRMLQTLFAERFKLAARIDQKENATYALTVGKGGAKLKESTPSKAGDQRCKPGDGAPEQIHMVCEHMTMKEFATNLRGMAPRYINMPVVDKTGMTGFYEFQLDWSPMAAPPGGSDGALTIETAGGLTMFDAVAKLGLKLERAKLPVPYLVIDHIERLAEEK